MYTVILSISDFQGKVNGYYSLLVTIATSVAVLALGYTAFRFLYTPEKDVGRLVQKIIYILGGYVALLLLPYFISWGTDIGRRGAWNPDKYAGTSYLSEYSSAAPIIVMEADTSPPPIDITDQGRQEAEVIKDDIKSAMKTNLGMSFWEDAESGHQVPWDAISMVEKEGEIFTVSWDGFSVVDVSWGVMIARLGDEMERRGYARYDNGFLIPASSVIVDALFSDLPDSSMWKGATILVHADLSRLMRVESDGQFTLYSRRTLANMGIGEYTFKRLGVTFSGYGEETWRSNSWYGQMPLILDDDNVNAEDVLDMLFLAGIIAKGR